MLNGDPGDSMRIATFALILRTRDSGLYERFIDGEAEDEEVADEIFSWTRPSFRTDEASAFLEATIITAAAEVKGGLTPGGGAVHTKLYEHHLSRFPSPSETWTLDQQRAVFILRFVDNAVDGLRHGLHPSFKDVVLRMELVVGDDREVQA